MTDQPLASVQEPPEQAAKMNMQTFIILLSVIVIVGAFVSYVSKTLKGPESDKAPVATAPEATSEIVPIAEPPAAEPVAEPVPEPVAEPPADAATEPPAEPAEPAASPE